MAKLVGRPSIKKPLDSRVTIGLRVTGRLKDRIEEAANANHRSLSAESEFRLERSLAFDALFPSEDVLAWAHVMAHDFAASGAIEGRRKGLGTDRQWMADPECLQAATMGVLRLLSQNMLAAGCDPETVALIFGLQAHRVKHPATSEWVKDESEPQQESRAEKRMRL